MILKSILRQVDNAASRIHALLRTNLQIPRRSASPSTRTSGAPSTSVSVGRCLTPVIDLCGSPPSTPVIDLCGSPPSTPVSSKNPVPENSGYVDLTLSGPSSPEQEHGSFPGSTPVSYMDLNSVPSSPEQEHGSFPGLTPVSYESLFDGPLVVPLELRSRTTSEFEEYTLCSACNCSTMHWFSANEDCRQPTYPCISRANR